MARAWVILKPVLTDLLCISLGNGAMLLLLLDQSSATAHLASAKIIRLLRFIHIVYKASSVTVRTRIHLP